MDQDEAYKPCWVVRTKEGHQFSVHPLDDRKTADLRAEKIGGYVEPYTPTRSTYWDPSQGNHYDH